VVRCKAQSPAQQAAAVNIGSANREKFMEWTSAAGNVRKRTRTPLETLAR